MFEDQNKEPEDIFADAEPETRAPGAIQPSTPNQAAQPLVTGLPSDDVETSGPSRTLVIVGILIAVAILVLIAVLAGIWLSRRTPAGTTTTQTNPLTDSFAQPLPTTNNTVPEPTPTVDNEPNPVQPVDTDSDGLTDEEEATYRTNPSLADSDEDGLSDSEEVRIWDTDPLDADTDNDTFSDGTEVKAGYDPNLAGGRLLDINNPPAAQPAQ